MSTWDPRIDRNEAAGLATHWSGDVLVIGGGSAGCAAAVAAARRGADVALVESGGFLGGTGARVLDTFYGFYAPGGEQEARRVVGGLGWEVCERLFGAGQAFERPNTYGAGTGVTYEPEHLKIVWDQLVLDAGVHLLLHGLMTRVVTEGGAENGTQATVVGVVVETRAGPRLLQSSVVVDATGDGEVAWRAGCSLERPSQERMAQPATATFRLGGVADKPASTADIHERMRAAVASGEYDLPRVEGSIHVTNLPGVRHANMTRVTGFDVTDPDELTQAEIEGRRQVQDYSRFLVDQVPGYDEAYLIGTSTRLGVRESRRLVGAYVLTEDDVLDARQFPDGIALCGAPIEDHAAGNATRWAYVGRSDTPTGGTYGIPYRSLLPGDVDGLLVAGRCLSASHDAHASVRSMGQCMAMGQAAGTAGVLAVDGGEVPRTVDTERLRKQLIDDEALL
jgi:hypothetical protein